MLDNSMQFSHRLLSEIVLPGDTVIDATMGNGHDTLFLSNLVQKNGHVFSFDVQSQAIQKTHELLKSDSNTHERVTLIEESHEHILDFVSDPIKGAIFNLGYLPGGDKSIITRFNSTLDAVKQCLQLVVQGGRIVLVCYYGHPGGKEELEQILDFVSNLDQHRFSCLRYEFINQINNPPILLCIERKK